MEFNYTNLDNNKKINFKVDDSKKIIAIYGKNGVGKTTFSTNEVWDKNYVFNEIFIRENIYVTTDTGVSTTAENKKNFSSLFIGKDIIELKKQQEKLEDNKKIFKEKLDEGIKKIQDMFSIKIIESDVTTIIDKYLHQIIELDPEIKYEELEHKLSDMTIETTIDSEESFNEKMIILNSHDKIEAFISILNRNKILKGAIIENDGLSSYKGLIDSIFNLKSLLESKEKMDVFLKERQILETPGGDIIKEFLRIQNDHNVCFLCGEKNKLEDILKWNQVLKNDFESNKNNLVKELTSIQDVIKSVNEIKSSFEKDIPKTLLFINNLGKEVTEIKEKVIKNDLNVTTSIDLVDFEQITKDAAELKTDLISYCLSNDSKQLIGSTYQIRNISNKTKEIKAELDSRMESQIESIVNDVNGILKQMQVEKDIQIEINRNRGNYTYAFKIGDKSIDALSDGYRHKLALAFFIASIQKLGLKNKTVVFDDPVVCLDELGYHVLKDTIIKLRKSEETLRVFILTHNIFYLYVQLSNIYTNEVQNDLTAFYRMNSTEVREYDINILRMDDLILFRKCIDEITNGEELLIIAGIVFKIFRQLIDLKLRIKGVMYNNEISTDIRNLKLSEIDEKKLLKINRKINNIIKDSSKFDIIKSKEIIVALKDGLKILGIEEYFSDYDLSRLDNHVSNKVITDFLSTKNILFEMVDAVNDVVYRGLFPEIRNYLAHPRQQITKQITSLSNDF